jgi:hypothetical protein
MRHVWWVGLLSALLMLSACDQDEGDAGDAGDVGGDADVSPDGGGVGPAVCTNEPIFEDSCAADFFGCFNPSGTCTIQSRPAVGDFEHEAIVWTSGAEWVVGYDNVNGDRTDRALNSNGNQCASASSSQPLATGARNPTFSLDIGTDQLEMEIDASGNLRITCPGGAQETYNATQAATLFRCLGASCNGEIPFVD